jgi:hypothetical protein
MRRLSRVSLTSYFRGELGADLAEPGDWHSDETLGHGRGVNATRASNKSIQFLNLTVGLRSSTPRKGVQVADTKAQKRRLQGESISECGYPGNVFPSMTEVWL